MLSWDASSCFESKRTIGVKQGTQNRLESNKKPHICTKRITPSGQGGCQKRGRKKMEKIVHREKIREGARSFLGSRETRIDTRKKDCRQEKRTKGGANRRPGSRTQKRR